MSTFNKVILVGHLGNEPTIKTTEKQVKVADFSIATNEVYLRNGEKNELTDWHEVVAWRKLADFSERFLKKGTKVMIEGRLKTNTWLEKENGNKRKSVYILADHIRFMDKRDPVAGFPVSASGDLQGDTSEEEFSQSGDAEDDEIPF